MTQNIETKLLYSKIIKIQLLTINVIHEYYMIQRCSVVIFQK